MTNAAEAVYKELEEKRKFALPKINNSKQRRAALVACETTEAQLFCVTCEHDAEGPRRVPLESNANGDRVCTVCGTVADRAASASHDYSDGMRSATSFRANTRLNYMRERLSQWCMEEPAIPSADVAALRGAFNGGFGRLDPQLGTFEFDPFLPKHTVRAVINRAGVAAFKYTEKWLTIRVLLGCEPHPMPTRELRMFIEKSFITLDKVWSCFKPELSPDRSSLFSYNFVFHMLLLLHSVESYVTHSPWFPLTAGAKIDELTRIWALVCKHAGWIHYEAVIADDGTVQRVVVNGEPSRGVFGRSRRMTQTRINLSNV